MEDKEPPQKINSIDFGVHSGEEMVRMSVMECNKDEMYTHMPSAPGQPTVREAARCGPLDRRLGTTDKASTCATCGEPLQTCSGHFGFLRLTLPVFHQGYFKAIIAVLSCICKTCSRILLVPEEAASALAFMRRVTVPLSLTLALPNPLFDSLPLPPFPPSPPPPLLTLSLHLSLCTNA